MIPNQRLRIVFGIDNAFTSDDEDYAVRFVTSAANVISLKHECWVDLSMVLGKAAQENIGWLEAAAGSVHLASLVQVLTM